jgi:hypothetical protein
MVHARHIEGHHAHTRAFFGSLRFIEEEFDQVSPRLSGQGVGYAIHIVRALHVDESGSLSGRDGQLGRSEIIIHHRDGVFGFTLCRISDKPWPKRESGQQSSCLTSLFALPLAAHGRDILQHEPLQTGVWMKFHPDTRKQGRTASGQD